MKYDSGNFPVFQQIPKQHNAHVLAYILHKMDFEQMEMRVASCGSYLRSRTEKMDKMFNRIAHSPTFSFENVAASVHEAWIKASPEKHDAHVKAYQQDFLNQLLRIYRHQWMTPRNQLHADPTLVGVDTASSQDSSSFWYEYGKDNLFSSSPAQTSGVDNSTAVSFKDMVDSIEAKLAALGISDEALTADPKTSNSYLSLRMLKQRPKSPSNITIDFSRFRQYQTGKTQLFESITDVLFAYSRAMDEDKDRATELRNAELTGGVRLGSLDVFGVYTGGGKSQMYYTEESTWMQTQVTQDSTTDQTYKKRKHIPNNQEAQKDRKAKLLAKNKFFK